MGRIPSRVTNGGGGRGSGSRVTSIPDGNGTGSRGSNTQGTPRTTPLVYQLHDTPETPDSTDSVATSFTTNAPLVGRPGSSTGTARVSLNATLAAEAAAAEIRANEAREVAAAASLAEVAAAAASAAAAAAVAAAANANDDEDPGDDDKITLTVVPGRKPRFQPSASTMLNKIFKLRVDIEGSNWTKVTQVMKDFYWEEFKKHFKWVRGAEGPVKQCWNKAAAKRYYDFINDRKKETKKRDYVPEVVWNRWIADWNTPEALELSRKKRAARMGSRNGQCSRHTGGSITTSEHATRFEIKNKRKPTCNELFDLTHKKKDDSYVDDKSASVDAAFKARKLELSQRSNLNAPMPTDDEIFVEVAGGRNKEGDVYGLGSASSMVGGESLSSGTSCMQPQLFPLSAMQELIQQAFIDFGQQSEESFGRRIGKEVESQISTYASTLLNMQNLVAGLASNPRVPVRGPVSQEETGSGDKEAEEDHILGEDPNDPEN